MTQALDYALDSSSGVSFRRMPLQRHKHGEGIKRRNATVGRLLCSTSSNYIRPAAHWAVVEAWRLCRRCSQKKVLFGAQVNQEG